MRLLVIAATLGLAFHQQASVTDAPFTDPTFRGGADMDIAIEEAIAAGEIPGAVVLVGHNGGVVYQKSWGARAVVPAREPMTINTVFDAASLTKVVATAPSIMKLVERGRIRLNDPVTKYLPEFQGGKSEITVRQLLTHFSGLRADVDLRPEWSGYETGIHKALVDAPVALPNSRFIYSDINFILLGEIVRRVGGKPLEEFAKTEIYQPLGMHETGFRPDAALLPRIAPTEYAGPGQPPLRGVVHDETTRFMGGVAGHAGLFTTAADLSRFAQMMLNRGELAGVRVFSPITVQMMTAPHSPLDQIALRGLGWDIDSPFAGNRGDLFPIGSYGHTGFTGTSLWIDPATQSYVILLANAVHPVRKAAITSLRGRVASIAAAGLGLELPPGIPATRAPLPVPAKALAATNLETLTGLDVLVAEGFARLKGKRVGLITNHTGISRDGKRNVDLMRAAGVDVRALFSPEHGIAGKEDHEKIGHAVDETTGIRVFSLYSGPDRRPSAQMLAGIDTLVFDIQDIGTRFYTYVCTMSYAMEEAAKRNLVFVVLDRPNPITGEHVEGPMIEAVHKSFVGCLDIPLRHGMTMGELARMHAASVTPQPRLEVVPLQNWRRSAWWDETGLPWVNPSPNMRSLNAALLYPGVGMLEYTKDYSVGRGTDAPFEQVGAAWIRGRGLAAYLNQRAIPGIRVYPALFTPTASNLANTPIEGIRFVITGRDAFNSTRFGLELAAAFEKLYPGKMRFAGNERLAGSREVIGALEKGESADAILQREQSRLRAFEELRARYLLYR